MYSTRSPQELKPTGNRTESILAPFEKAISLEGIESEVFLGELQQKYSKSTAPTMGNGVEYLINLVWLI